MPIGAGIQCFEMTHVLLPFFLSSEYSLHTHRVSQEKQKENYFLCGAIL
jgi:hypothetical protein